MVANLANILRISTRPGKLSGFKRYMDVNASGLLTVGENEVKYL